jgi:hypothetical protein
VRQGYSEDDYASSGARLAIALAEAGRIAAAEETLARAKDTIRNLSAQPYTDNIHADQEFTGALQEALAALAAAYAGANDFDTALARARQIGDAEFLRLAGMAEDSNASPIVLDNPMEFLSAMSGISNAGGDGRVDVVLALTNIASIQLDRQDTDGARQTLAQDQGSLVWPRQRAQRDRACGSARGRSDGGAASGRAHPRPMLRQPKNHAQSQAACHGAA